MDNTDLRILNLLKGNARMSFQEIGNAVGMSRVAAKKRVKKLENEGIIRGYNTCIYREDEITLFIDIVTVPGKYEDVLKYVTAHTAYIRQIFRTTKENHIHMVAVSDQASNLKYLTKMIQKKCSDGIAEIHCHAVKEIIKDVYGGIRYENDFSEKLRNGQRELRNSEACRRACAFLARASARGGGGGVYGVPCGGSRPPK
jgi:DNA-binding Lrp family transcriptional regulator